MERQAENYRSSETEPRRAAGAAGGVRPAAIGPLAVWPPVVLAPMAGVTNSPFRALCRRFGAGLYVCEMITARALVEGNREDAAARRASRPDETPRSLQLYGVDPHYVGEAVRLLVGEGRVDHIDMNFGCPVRKVTRRGGGAAMPAEAAAAARASCAPRSRAAGRGAGDGEVPHRHRRRARSPTSTPAASPQEEGCAAVALHARTAAQLYDGEADWDAIAELKQHVTRIPVLGNGDIWEAEDALRMMRDDRLRRRRRRPRLPRPAVAVPRPRRRLRRPRAATTRRASARSSTCMLEHARAARRVAGESRAPCAPSASTRLVHARLPRQRRRCASG